MGRVMSPFTMIRSSRSSRISFTVIAARGTMARMVPAAGGASSVAMTAITVIGTGFGAPAARVAAVLTDGRSVLVGMSTGADAEMASAGLDAVHVLPMEASPLVAARHAGVVLDPADLVELAADAEVFALDGGALAPLTPRWSVRDLARELGRPVVLALRATGGLTAEGRGELEALRGGGLAVLGVILTEWPEPPSRVLLDELDVLAELGGVPVEPLAEAARAVADWTARGDAHVLRSTGWTGPTLEPYVSWEGAGAGDPRTTPRPRIMQVMLDIVGSEGPMVATRAYALYNRAAGGRKLTSVARAPLSSAVYWLAREGKVLLTGSEDAPGLQEDDLIRLPDTPAVRVRELGPRTLEDVPLDEVAELVRRLRTGRRLPDAHAKRAVLDAYGLVRLTSQADAYLDRALALTREGAA